MLISFVSTQVETSTCASCKSESRTESPCGFVVPLPTVESEPRLMPLEEALAFLVPPTPPSAWEFRCSVCESLVL